MIRRLTLIAAALALAGCASLQPAGPKAAAKLEPRSGSATSGTVTFEQRGGKTVVTAEVRGLRPNAEHGFHVHERGDCSAPDAMSAGGHFNPKSAPHGNHAAGAHHAGDMPNLKADASGVARFTWEDDELTVAEGPASVVGKAVVVHRDPDDFKSQPAGNSGPRIACGVVARA
jgi:Cu-Zn family superoxide dismutase